MFFNRKKDKDEPIILDCYTHSSYAYDHAKINHARHHIPDWWKKTKHMCNSQPTIKVCSAIKEHYLKGIVVPLWGELEITLYPLTDDTTPTYEWRSSNLDFDTQGSHSTEQFFGFAGKDGVNLKITAPWVIKSKELIHFTYTQPVWSQPDMVDDLTLLPGVLEFKNQHAIELNYFFRQRETKRKVNIHPLTPMVIMHPMSERPIKFKHHYIEDKNVWLDRFAKKGVGMFLDLAGGASMDLQKYYKKRNKFWEKRDKIEKTPLI